MEQFLRYVEHLNLHPLIGKKPYHSHWREIQSTADDIRHWISEGFQSFGVITEKLAVVDCDDMETARAFFRQYRSKIKSIVLTPRPGVHFYFRNDGSISNRQHVQCGGMTYDIRGVGGYAVAAGSITTGEYVFADGYDEVDPRKLEPFDESWSPRSGSPLITRGRINDVRSYVMRIDSVSGQQGSRGLVRAAAVCRDNGLTESEATVLMLQWNQKKALPSWSEQELTRAISRTYGAKQ
jgi:hypothetical protein